MKHTDCAFVSGGVKLIDYNGNFLEVPGQSKIEKDHYKILLQSNYIWTPGAVMYRRSVFNVVDGFDSSAEGSADYELNIRIARQFPIGCHGEIILEYRMHDLSMSKNFAYMLKSGINVRRAQYKYVKHDAALLTAWKAGIHLIREDLGNKLIRQIPKKVFNKQYRKDIFRDVWYILKYYPLGLLKLFRNKLKRL
jgi:hypothetical protein